MIPEPDAFHRRTYTVIGLLVALWGLLWRLPRILAVQLGSKRLRPAWREALWLAVTEVNGCRFCSYVHEGMAGAAGLDPADIQQLSRAGDASQLTGFTDQEILALAYAKAWADRDGAPPEGLIRQLGEALSSRQVADLHALLFTISFANRAGNTADAALHRLRHPRQLVQLWATLNDLVVGTLVALFGWPALVMGALLRWRNRRSKKP